MKKILPTLFLVLSFFLPGAVFAQLNNSDTGLSKAVETGYGVTTIVGLPTFIGTYIIKPVLGITGTILFLLMTYAGFLWLTAQGDPKKVQKAKDILTECIVGMVILLSAYALSSFVVTTLGGT